VIRVRYSRTAGKEVTSIRISGDSHKVQRIKSTTKKLIAVVREYADNATS